MMNLTTETAIRIMMRLGVSGRKTIVSLADIHREIGGSLTYLAKITSALSRAGLVVSRRGASGGIWLAKNPENISLYDILCAVRGRKDVGFVLSDDAPADRLKKVCGELDRIFVQELKKRSLADVLPVNRKN